MIDGQEVFNSLPTSVQNKLGANTDTYTQLEDFGTEGLALLTDSDLSDKAKEQLAIIYARAHAYLLAGYNEMFETLYGNFLNTRKHLEQALEKEPLPPPDIYVETEELPFDEDELEKW